MKIILSIFLVILFALTAFSQNDLSEPAIKKLPLAKKQQIAKLLANIYEAKEVYLNSTDDKAITLAVAWAVKDTRKIAASLPKGFLKQNLIAGAGAWEKSFFFRYDSPSQTMLSLAQKQEIIKVYKLQDIAPEDRAAKLFDYAQAFFDIAADIAVASGIKPR